MLTLTPERAASARHRDHHGWRLSRKRRATASSVTAEQSSVSLKSGGNIESLLLFLEFSLVYYSWNLQLRRYFRDTSLALVGPCEQNREAAKGCANNADT